MKRQSQKLMAYKNNYTRSLHNAGKALFDSLSHPITISNILINRPTSAVGRDIFTPP